MSVLGGGPTVLTGGLGVIITLFPVFVSSVSDVKPNIPPADLTLSLSSVVLLLLIPEPNCLDVTSCIG